MPRPCLGRCRAPKTFRGEEAITSLEVLFVLTCCYKQTHNAFPSVTSYNVFFCSIANSVFELQVELLLYTCIIKSMTNYLWAVFAVHPWKQSVSLTVKKHNNELPDLISKQVHECLFIIYEKWVTFNQKILLRLQLKGNVFICKLQQLVARFCKVPRLPLWAVLQSLLLLQWATTITLLTKHHLSLSPVSP